MFYNEQLCQMEALFHSSVDLLFSSFITCVLLLVPH